MRISPIATRLAGIALLALATAAGAQNGKHGTVRITVRDSSGSPISNADLTLTRGLRETVARGRTDDAGKSVLSFEVSDSTDLQVTMRKLGYARADHFFEGAPNGMDSLTFVVGAPLTNTLATVKVTAEADLRRKSYYINADDIEAVDSPSVDNGWELIKRMRPDMLTSRGGCATGAQQIWVNGKWIRLPLMPVGLDAARARVGAPPRARYNYAPVSVLQTIAPEHIQEITYHDCWDRVDNVGLVNAVVVVLKPGVAYQENVGSFVDDLPKPAAKKP
ncbi:MAG: carboxypeptidase-like regulatory domain-containing protein [Gemmatimonadaceae bacterium]